MARSKLVSFGVLVAALLLSLSALAAIVADVAAYRASLQERFWAEGEPIASVGQWQQVNQSVITALNLEPRNPDHLLRMGRLAIWRLFVGEEGEDIVAEVEQGYDAYWAEGWAEFALFKAQTAPPDEEFEFAVFAAMGTGPLEARAILNVLKATFLVWEDLSPDMQADMRNQFAMAIDLEYPTQSNLSNDSLDLALGFGVLTDVCNSPDISEVGQAKCDNALERQALLERQAQLEEQALLESQALESQAILETETP